jgi:hypothetical protein
VVGGRGWAFALGCTLGGIVSDDAESGVPGCVQRCCGRLNPPAGGLRVGVGCRSGGGVRAVRVVTWHVEMVGIGVLGAGAGRQVRGGGCGGDVRAEIHPQAVRGVTWHVEAAVDGL